jgi:hypothetical protein
MCFYGRTSARRPRSAGRTSDDRDDAECVSVKRSQVALQVCGADCSFANRFVIALRSEWVLDDSCTYPIRSRSQLSMGGPQRSECSPARGRWAPGR